MIIDHLPAMDATIERRIFVTYRADPDAVRPLVPERYDLRLTDGWAIGGVCLLRLGNTRPRHMPRWVGVSSENAAHRISIVGPDGEPAIWSPRRDTDSHLTARLGRTLYPSAPGTARFDIGQDDERFNVQAVDADGHTVASIDATRTDALATTSVFADVAALDDYYRSTRHGYSPTSDPESDGCITVDFEQGEITPLAVRRSHSTVFDPLVAAGSAALDHVVLMRQLSSTWQFGRRTAS